MKHTLSYNPPIESLGELLSELEKFMNANPNPGEGLRSVRLRVTIGGKVRSIVIEDDLNET